MGVAGGTPTPLSQYIWCISKLGNIFRSQLEFFFLQKPVRTKYAVLHQSKRCSFQIKDPATKNYISLCFKSPKMMQDGQIVKTLKMHNVCCHILRLFSILGKRTFYYPVQEILPFVFTTKQPPNDKWLPRY